jgi:hypothetical protein
MADATAQGTKTVKLLNEARNGYRPPMRNGHTPTVNVIIGVG